MIIGLLLSGISNDFCLWGFVLPHTFTQLKQNWFFFHKFTKGPFDAKYPKISNAVGGGYGTYPERYSKLELALSLDEDAAYKSASYGASKL